jgi:hypothetical protein
LAEVLEDGGHSIEAFAAGLYPCKDCVELVSDALLLVEGGEWKFGAQDCASAQFYLIRSTGREILNHVLYLRATYPRE